MHYPLSFILLFALSVNVSALTLNDAIDKTLKTHPTAVLASLHTENAVEESTITQSALYPRIDLNGAYYPTKTYVMPANGMFSTKQNNGVHVDITGVYSLWDANRVQKKIKAATNAQEVALSRQELTQSELIEQVWLRYYGIAYTASLIESAESSVKFYEGVYNQAHNMRKNGLKTEADELRFKASVMESHERLAWAKSEYDKARLALSLLIGDDDLIGVDTRALDEQSNAISLENSTIESLRQTLRIMNPRLKGLQATISQSQLLRDAVKSEHLGEVMLVGSAGYDNSLSTYNSYQLGIAGTIPLYDGGKLSSEVQKSRIAHSIALKEFENVERELWQALYGAYRDLVRANETIKAKEGVVEATTKTLHLFEERYKQGLSNYIDVLESKNTLDNAQFGVIEAKYQKIRAYALLQKLLNRGCENDVCK